MIKVSMVISDPKWFDDITGNRGNLYSVTPCAHQTYYLYTGTRDHSGYGLSQWEVDHSLAELISRMIPEGLFMVKPGYIFIWLKFRECGVLHQICSKLTHWSQWKVTVISRIYFQMYFMTGPVSLPPDEHHRISSMISQHCLPEPMMTKITDATWPQWVNGPQWVYVYITFIPEDRWIICVMYQLLTKIKCAVLPAFHVQQL